MNQAPQQVVWNIPQSFDRLMQYCPHLLQPAIHLSLSGQLGGRHLSVRSMDIWHDHLKLTYNYAGRPFRLTDVAGEVVHDIIA